MTNYDLLNQEKGLDGKALAQEHLKIVKDALKDFNACGDERKIYELNVTEFKNLMVECFEMLKQKEHDTSTEEYKRLTTKPIKAEEVFVKGGIPISKEY